MIKPFSLESYCCKLLALGATPEFVDRLRLVTTKTSLNHEANSRSSTFYYNSRKMKQYMRCGSRLEQAVSYSLDYDARVAGYFFKVGEMILTFRSRDGAPVSHRHSPDVLVLKELPESAGETAFHASDYVVFVECKYSSQLEKDAYQGGRFELDRASGRIESTSGARSSLEEYGFGYRTTSEQDYDPLVVSNYEFLHAYNARNVPQASADLATKVRGLVAHEQGISAPELLVQTPGLTTDFLFKLITDRKVYVPLHISQLDFLRTVAIYTDEAAFLAICNHLSDTDQQALRSNIYSPRYVCGEELLINGRKYTIVAPSENDVIMRNESGAVAAFPKDDLRALLAKGKVISKGVPRDNLDESRAALLKISPIRLTAGLDRLAILQPVLEGREKLSSLKNRLPNAKSWLRRVRRAKLKSGIALLGAIDNRHSQGWQGSHLTNENEGAIAEAIETDYLTNRARTKTSAYAYYRTLCKERGILPVSSKTFNLRIRRVVAEKAALRREGSMSAAAERSPAGQARHFESGGRWFLHVVHADEVVIDLMLIFPELGLPAGTCWAVAMTDDHTRTAVAIVFTFEPPSYTTTMLVLAECYRRWSRFPEFVCCDNGPGFRNASLLLAAKYFGFQLVWRPAGQPRWGSCIERFGGDVNQRVAGELRGATKAANKLRRLSLTHSPSQLASLGLTEAESIFREWSYDVFDNLPHGGLHGKTPREVREISVQQHGTRGFLQLHDDPLFRIMLLPAPEGDGTLKVQAHDGIQVCNLYYWHPAFEDPLLVGTRVEARWDPTNITRIYAFIRGTWEQCECLKLKRLKQLSSVDLCAASMEIRRWRKEHNRKRNDYIERVREFLDGASKKGEELADLLRTKESAKRFLRHLTPDALKEGPSTADITLKSTEPKTIAGFGPIAK